MKDPFIKNLIKLAENDPKVMLIVGDLGFGMIEAFIDLARKLVAEVEEPTVGEHGPARNGVARAAFPGNPAVERIQEPAAAGPFAEIPRAVGR